ncbi:hypothetical protein AMAG_08466 [Allomyces macrogynus ATCC 38327]|uniref:Uncharacterized protein n=1 Tax=Allomyces macrogynus (strain ATCC 38327) TaxID=578462 RepID=A0A0L0SLD3_ALLM3|nr:hypothetical protein AMAG_08466 [Allomyces macrogynus ATCC 38327]|eukprot:KNE63327.1 hypothetical protein AMAG_08466 [Allomyces macrogynus ATCC 38327]
MSPSSARVAAVTLPSPAVTGSAATDASAASSKPPTPTSAHFPGTPNSSTVVTVSVLRRSRRMVAAMRRRSPMRWPAPAVVRVGTPVLLPVGHADDDEHVVDDGDGARVVVVTMDHNEMHHSTADLTPASPVREVAVAAEGEAVAVPAEVDANAAPVAVAALATNSSTSAAPTPTMRYHALVPAVDLDPGAKVDADRADAADHAQHDHQHDQSGRDLPAHDKAAQDPHEEAEPPRRRLLPTPTPSSPSASDLTIPSPTASTTPASSVSTNSTYRVPSLRSKIAHLRHELAATRDVLADTNGALRAALDDRASLVRENAALRAQIQVLAAALQESAGIQERVHGSGGSERAGAAGGVVHPVVVEHARNNGHDDDELVGAGCDVTCSPRRAGARCAARWPVAPAVAPAVREWATTTRSAVAPRAAAAARTTAAAARTLARSTSTASRTATAWVQRCKTSHDDDDPYTQAPHVPVPGPPIRAGAPRVGPRSAASIARLRAQAMAASSAGGGTPMSFRHALAATGPGTGTGSVRQRLRVPARSRLATEDTAVANEDEDDGYIDIDAPISSPPAGPVPTVAGAPARASWTPHTARAATPAPVVAADVMPTVSGVPETSGSSSASASPPRAPLCLVHGIVTDVPPLAVARRRASAGMGGMGARQSAGMGTSWPPPVAA